MPIRYLVRGDTAPESPETKNLEFPGVSRECPGATPATPKGGGSYRGLQKHMYGGTSPSGGEKALLVSFELGGKPLTRITNCKLGWVLGASTDVRAWIMSCLTPISVSRSSPGPAADGTRVGDESYLEARAGL